MAVIATGFFDGVHLGHRQIIKTLLECAEQRSEKSLIVTFWPHPRVALGLDAGDFHLLNTREEKLALLRSLGVDEVVELEFTREFAAMTTRQYLEMLVRNYQASCIVLGYDNRIGSDQLSPEDTAQIVRSLGLDVVVEKPLTIALSDSQDAPELAISSSRIRQALKEGNVELADRMLGYLR